MTVLNEETLAPMLATILDLDPSFVVPKQGNWFNPQDMTPTPQKPMTWCAYAIDDEEPIDLPHYVADSTPANWSVQHKRARLVLQFVGTDAKRLASSVGHWVLRQSAQDQFALVDGRIMGDSGRVRATDFYQDGENTVKAYNTSVGIIYASEIETGQDVVTEVDFQGVVS